MWLLDRGYDYEAWQVLQRIGRINGKESFRCALCAVLDAILKFTYINHVQPVQ